MAINQEAGEALMFRSIPLFKPLLALKPSFLAPDPYFGARVKWSLAPPALPGTRQVRLRDEGMSCHLAFIHVEIRVVSHRSVS